MDGALDLAPLCGGHKPAVVNRPPRPFHWLRFFGHIKSKGVIGSVLASFF